MHTLLKENWLKLHYSYGHCLMLAEIDYGVLISALYLLPLSVIASV